METEVYATIATAIISVAIALGGGAFAHFRAKLSAVRRLLAAADDAMQDGKITPEEATRIIAQLREVAR